MSRLASAWGRIRARFRREPVEPVKWWRELAEQEKRLSERIDMLAERLRRNDDDVADKFVHVAERLDAHSAKLEKLAGIGAQMRSIAQNLDTTKSQGDRIVAVLEEADELMSEDIEDHHKRLAKLRADYDRLSRRVTELNKRLPPKPRAKAKRP